MLAAILALPLGVGLYYYRRAESSVGQFFLSERDLPWWLAGTSMVATTFAADTPLAVTGVVTENGIAGNWLWWNAGLGSMLTVFFLARLCAAPGFSPMSSSSSSVMPAGPPRCCEDSGRCISGYDQLLDHRLGQSGDGQDPVGNARLGPPQAFMR